MKCLADMVRVDLELFAKQSPEELVKIVKFLSKAGLSESLILG